MVDNLQRRADAARLQRSRNQGAARRACSPSIISRRTSRAAPAIRAQGSKRDANCMRGRRAQAAQAGASIEGRRMMSDLQRGSPILDVRFRHRRADRAARGARADAGPALRLCRRRCGVSLWRLGGGGAAGAADLAVRRVAGEHRAGNRGHRLQHRLDAGRSAICAPPIPTCRSSAPCRRSSRRRSARARAWCRCWRRPARSSAPIRAISSSPSPANAMCGWSAARIWRAWPRPIFAARRCRDEAVLAEIAPCFVEADGRRTDIVVLACTHYPFLANIFRRLAPWPVDWLDPAEAIARRALSLINPIHAGRSRPASGPRHRHLGQSGFLRRGG